MQPDQQQGRRLPAISSARVLSMWFFLVSCFLTVIVQQIHSLRASGVIFSHAASAFGLEARALRKSAGILCITPVVVCFVAIDPFYQVFLTIGMLAQSTWLA